MSQHTLFISDLHLEPAREDITARFLQFMNEQASQADALYILGDFFEMWIGDDDATPFFDTVTEVINTLTQKNIPVYFLPGNHDFLAGKTFLEKTGCQALNDPTLINCYGREFLLCHGDILCTQDKKHLAFRKFSQSGWFKRIFLATPLSIRRRLAKGTRTTSHHFTEKTEHYIMDVTEDAVSKLMQKHTADILIHGHTHRPGVFKVNGVGERIVLGSWHNNGSALVVKNDASFELITF